MSNNSLTQNGLKSRVSYDQDDGIVRWLRSGKAAGYKNANGYIIVMINGKNYPAHRLAWLYYYGVMPSLQIDHINHDRSDNRIENLRECTNQENQMNRKYVKNSSGVIGVYWDKSRNKWAPKIKVGQRMINLGRYTDIEEAIAIRLCAESHYGFHPNHGTIL